MRALALDHSPWTAWGSACDSAAVAIRLHRPVAAERKERSVAATEPPSEAALMERYCRGDTLAFEALYRSVARRLHRYLLGLTGTRDAADDLLQQTLLKLHEARDLYIRGADPVPWLFTIAHRTFLDDVRRRKRARVQLTTDGTFAVEPRANAQGLPEDADAELAAGVLSGPMLAALAQLPTQQREALLLTKVDGRSHAEAATLTGTSAGAIKLRAHRAYVALRALLAAKKEPG